MRHPYRTAALVFTAIVMLTGPGCSMQQKFQLILTILNKDDGKPVRGAKVLLDFHYDETTDVDGTTKYEFTVCPYPSDDPEWFLKVSKDGFEPVKIDIKPSPQPKMTNATIPLEVTVKLQPKAEPAADPAK